MPEAQGAPPAHGPYPKLGADPALVSWQYVALTVLQARTEARSVNSLSGESQDFLLVI